MNRDAIKIAVEKGNIEWQRHVLEKMMQRGISREIIKGVLVSGEVIEDYSNDKPFPSALFLGWIKGEPFHVVAAFDSQSNYCFVITAYKPNLEHFDPDYKTRKLYEN